jgi:uncharacterized phage protein (TIGR01671 family)
MGLKMSQRTFKFRIWDTNSKSFSFSGYTEDLICGDDKDIIILDNSCSKTGQENRYIFQQFTELKDKNGKDIYEGDILSGKTINDGTPWTAKVEFNPYGGYYVKCTEVIYDYCLYENEVDFSQTEVIGNILENPEIVLSPLK